jgi:YHS domain-containing protein
MKKIINKKQLVLTMILIWVLTLSASLAASLSQINIDPDNIAISGYDPVAYFTMGKPMEGDEALAYTWNGATWWFSSKEHLELFKAAPDKYAPQYGGY